MDLLGRINEIDFSVHLGAEQTWMVTRRIRLGKGGWRKRVLGETTRTGRYLKSIYKSSALKTS